ncbi:MAG: hypothetical protein M3Q50_15175 [Chloroflexota bacterium]|nr:hypothetical protein [Chloroflexia bacterium]MDQ3227956.1 hypothetical protein [Chloroflexota bacterium]
MRFGRVEGVVTPVESDGKTLLRLTVWLETGSRIDTIREETLAPLREAATFADLVWHADQWTQETIGTTLAERGWEAIGAGELPTEEPGALPRSASYGVRNLTWESWKSR